MNIVTLVVVAYLGAGTEAGGPNGSIVEQRHENVFTWEECMTLAEFLNNNAGTKGPHKFAAYCILKE